MPDIGLRLKELRKRHKLSLLELSKLTKMSYSFLSGLENGKHSITIANLQKLAEFFGVDLVYFLQENDNDSIRLTRKEQFVPPTVEDGMTYQVLTPGCANALQVSRVSLPPHTPDEVKLHNHSSGDEVLSVLRGTLYVQVGDTEYQLFEGDTMYYPATYGHCIFAKESEAEFLLIMSPPWKI